MDISVIEHLAGFNGYDILTFLGCVLLIWATRKYDKIQKKKGFIL